MTYLAAIILAGGAARRLGGVDKPLLEIRGRTILARTLDALRCETSLIALAANGDPARYAAYPLPVVDDGALAGEGPLAGILAGLEWADRQGAEALLTVAGDMPFLPSGLAAALSPSPSFAATGGQDHPVIALWPVALLGTLDAWMVRSESRSVRAFAAAIGARAVDFADASLFANVNTPEDLAEARRRAAEG